MNKINLLKEKTLNFNDNNLIELDDYEKVMNQCYYDEIRTDYQLESNVQYTFSCDMALNKNPGSYAYVNIGIGDTSSFRKGIKNYQYTYNANKEFHHISINFTLTDENLSTYKYLFFRAPAFYSRKNLAYKVKNIGLYKSSTATFSQRSTKILYNTERKIVSSIKVHSKEPNKETAPIIKISSKNGSNIDIQCPTLKHILVNNNSVFDELIFKEQEWIYYKRIDDNGNKLSSTQITKLSLPTPYTFLGYTKIKIEGSNYNIDFTYIPMPIIVNKKQEIPDEYTQLNWMRQAAVFNGYNYIDTGITPNLRDFTIMVQFAKIGQYPFGVGYEGTMGRIACTTHSSFYLGNVSVNDIFSIPEPTKLQWYVISLKNTVKNYNINYIKHDKQEDFKKSQSIKVITKPLDQTLKIFGWTYNNTVRNNIGSKIGKFIIYNSGEKVREFIPCYRNGDTQMGYYDLVESKFYPFPNNGTLFGE